MIKNSAGQLSPCSALCKIISEHYLFNWNDGNAGSFKASKHAKAPPQSIAAGLYSAEVLHELQPSPYEDGKMNVLLLI